LKEGQRAFGEKRKPVFHGREKAAAFPVGRVGIRVSKTISDI